MTTFALQTTAAAVNVLISRHLALGGMPPPGVRLRDLAGYDPLVPADLAANLESRFGIFISILETDALGGMSPIQIAALVDRKRNEAKVLTGAVKWTGSPGDFVAGEGLGYGYRSTIDDRAMPIGAGAVPLDTFKPEPPRVNWAFVAPIIILVTVGLWLIGYGLLWH